VSEFAVAEEAIHPEQIENHVIGLLAGGGE